MGDVNVSVGAFETFLLLANVTAFVLLAVVLRRRRRPDGTRGEGPAVLDPEERLHEIRSSLAGVAAAIEVLTRQRGDLGVQHESPVAVMLREEIVRLKRLASVGETVVVTNEPDEVSVDDVVGRVVLARQLTGQEVSWRPTGQRLIAQPDQVVEILNTLLDNVSCHAAGALATVEVASQAGYVTMTVGDDGPGVPAGLRHSIFARGARRHDSRGDGLGLHVASNLVRAMGGTLALENTHGQGSAFTVKLPAAVSGCEEGV